MNSFVILLNLKFINVLTNRTQFIYTYCDTYISQNVETKKEMGSIAQFFPMVS